MHENILLTFPQKLGEQQLVERRAILEKAMLPGVLKSEQLANPLPVARQIIFRESQPILFKRLENRRRYLQALTGKSLYWSNFESFCDELQDEMTVTMAGILDEEKPGDGFIVYPEGRFISFGEVVQIREGQK